MLLYLDCEPPLIAIQTLRETMDREKRPQGEMGAHNLLRRHCASFRCWSCPVLAFLGISHEPQRKLHRPTKHGPHLINPSTVS